MQYLATATPRLFTPPAVASTPQPTSPGSPTCCPVASADDEQETRHTNGPTPHICLVLNDPSHPMRTYGHRRLPIATQPVQTDARRGAAQCWLYLQLAHLDPPVVQQTEPQTPLEISAPRTPHPKTETTCHLLLPTACRPRRASSWPPAGCAHTNLIMRSIIRPAARENYLQVSLYVA
jgi:hypothetical protein